MYSPLIIYCCYNKHSPLQIWNMLQNKPFGKQVYSCIIAIKSPYSSSISPEINYFTENECKCTIVTKRSIMNPFNSVHALALGNIGELTSGLIMLEWLEQNNKKGILTEIKCKYYKKARGKITAVCSLDSIENNSIKTQVFDKEKNLVCSVKCYWNIKHI